GALIELVLVKTGDRAGDLTMGAGPTSSQLGPVGDFFREGVLEGVLLIGIVRRLVDELSLYQGSERSREVVPAAVHHPTEHRRREMASDHRGRLKELFLPFGQAIDAGSKHCLHSGGDPHLAGG